MWNYQFVDVMIRSLTLFRAHLGQAANILATTTGGIPRTMCHA